MNTTECQHVGKNFSSLLTEPREIDGDRRLHLDRFTCEEWPLDTSVRVTDVDSRSKESSASTVTSVARARARRRQAHQRVVRDNGNRHVEPHQDKHGLT